MDGHNKNSNYSIICKSIMDSNLTEYDKEVFDMFEKIKTKNMLEGKYCDTSLRIPCYITRKYNRNYYRQKKNIGEISKLLDEIQNNKKMSKKQLNLKNKNFIELLNKIN